MEFPPPGVLAMLIPIVAIITGGAVSIVRALLRHQERIAMIERGIDPDADSEDS